MGFSTWINSGVSAAKDYRLLENSPWRWNKRPEFEGAKWIHYHSSSSISPANGAHGTHSFSRFSICLMTDGPGQKKLFKKRAPRDGTTRMGFLCNAVKSHGSTHRCFPKDFAKSRARKNQSPCNRTPSTHQQRQQAERWRGACAWLTDSSLLLHTKAYTTPPRLRLAKSLSENYLRLSKIVLPPAEEKWIKTSRCMVSSDEQPTLSQAGKRN